MKETNRILEDLRPWENLVKLIQEEADERIKMFIKASDSHDLRIAVNHLSSSQRAKLFNIIDPEDAADLLSYIPDSQGISIIEDLEYSDAASSHHYLNAWSLNRLGSLDQEASKLRSYLI